MYVFVSIFVTYTDDQGRSMIILIFKCFLCLILIAPVLVRNSYIPGSTTVVLRSSSNDTKEVPEKLC